MGNSFQPPGTFVKHLDREGFRATRSREKRDEFEIHWLDLTRLRIRASAFTPFLISDALSGHEIVLGSQIEEILPELKAISRHEAPGYVVLVVGGVVHKLGRNLEKKLRENSIALIDRKVIDQVLHHKSSRLINQALADALVQGLGRLALAPYAPGKPVSGSQFFGREQTMQRILASHGTNFTIYGNRRIGKTSLLREIRHRMSIRDPSVRFASLDGSFFNRPEDFLGKMVRDLGGRGEREEPSSILKTFVDEIQAILQAKPSPVVVFVDEFDRFLEYDQLDDYRTLTLLRAAFNDDRCQIFIAGFRRVRQAALDVQHPLFNFGPREEVRGLGREETVQMIVEPMRLLGIDLTLSDLPEAIFRETRGQPELVQLFGQAVVERVATSGQVPDTAQILREVLGSRIFRDKTYLTFLKNTTPYESLVCFLLLERAQKEGRNIEEFEFGPRDMDELLRDRDIQLGKADIELLASNLETSSVITEVRGGRSVKYEFTVPQLARDCVAFDLDWSIRDALREALEAVDDNSALLDLPQG